MADQKTTLGDWVSLLTKPALTLIAATLLSIAVAWQNVHAATLTVNDSGDAIVANSTGGTCTLREAIFAINQENLTLTDANGLLDGPSGCVNSSAEGFGVNNQILFDTNRTITTGLPVFGLFIANSVSINPIGPNQKNITLNANNRSRHFTMSTPEIIVEFNNIVFTNGSVPDIEPPDGEIIGGFAGSLLIQSANVTINNSTFTNNSAGTTAGAIFVSTQSGANATLNINNSTVSGNSTTGSSGISAGGIFAFGTANFTTTVNLTNTSIANNSANGDVGSVAVVAAGVTMSLSNSIIADSNGLNCSVSTGSDITADAQSIIEGNNCGSGARTIDPGLFRLSNNGGGTPTHALALESPAVNSGNNITCLATDQRGEPRPLTSADRCDVGAFEQNESDRDRLNANFIIIPISNNRAVVAPL